MKTWEKNYKNKKRFNNYPFDFVIKYTFKFFPKVSNKIRCLDLGCGGGGCTKFLNDLGFNTFAIDGSKTAVDLTKKKVKNKKQVIQGDFKNLKYKDNYFNYIIDRNSLTHNNEKDIDIIVKNIFRILKKGGIFISSIFSNRHHDIKYGKKIHGSKNTFTSFKSGTFKHAPVTFFADKKILLRLFNKFKIIDIVKITNNSLINKKKNEYFVLVLKK